MEADKDELTLEMPDDGWDSEAQEQRFVCQLLLTASTDTSHAFKTGYDTGIITNGCGYILQLN